MCALCQVRRRRSLSPSEQLTTEVIQEIMREDEPETREAQEQISSFDEVSNDDISGWSTVLNTINNAFEHECLEEALKLLGAFPVRQSKTDRVPGHKYTIPGLPVKFLAHQIWAIWFIVRRWVWDADMPGALLADEMGLGKTHTSLAAAMFCKLQTEKVVFGQPLSILWGQTLDEWINQAQNDYPAVPPEERGWYPLTKKNPVPRRLLEIKTTPPYGDPCLVSAHEPILIVTLPGICETFKSVIKDMSYNTDFTIIDLLDPNHYNLTNEDLNASADEPERRWNIHLISYNTFTARAKPNGQRQLT
jgi:hypothetical protein